MKTTEQYLDELERLCEQMTPANDSGPAVYAAIAAISSAGRALPTLIRVVRELYTFAKLGNRPITDGTISDMIERIINETDNGGGQ